MVEAQPTTLTALLRASSEDNTKLEFFTPDSHLTVTVSEVYERARRVAGALKDLGVEPRDRITVQMSNRVEAVILQYAALMLDAVLAPIVPVFGPRDVSHVLADSKPKVYVTEKGWNKFDYVAGLSEITEGLLPEHVVVVGGADGRIDWSSLEAHEPIEVASEYDERATCLVIYTSGSTGVPKGVQHTRYSIFAECVDIDYRPHQDSERDVYLQASAAGHIGGYMFPWRAVYYQMRTLIMDGWNAQLACRLVTTHRATAMVTTPFHVVSMVELAEADSSIDLSSMAMMIAGGAPIPPPLVRRADALGVTVVRAYGMSEHPTVSIGNWRDPLDVRAEADGYLSGGNVVRFIDDEGNEVPRGSLGEVQVKGPEQFIGYTNVPNSEAFTEDGWFVTGDVGRLDENGLLTIVDRKKNIIIRGGENLSATEIEDVVATHPSVREVGVIGVPDERYGERACAYVVLREGTTLDLESLRAHFAEKGVAKQKVPEFLEFVSSLPRTGTGKLRKHELLRLRAEA